MILDYRNLLGNEFLDISEKSHIVIVTKGNRYPFRSGPSGPTDAVHISFRDIRNIIIDHVFERVDIDSTGSNIGCDKNPGCLFLEIGECSLTIVLGFVSVNRFGDNPSSHEEFYDLVCAMLRSCKYEHILNLCILEKMNYEAILASFIDMIDLLTNRLSGG